MNTNFGSDDCPCVITKDLLEVNSSNNCSVITYGDGLKTTQPCLSTNYGSTSCTTHDLNEPTISGCGKDNSSSPRFCYESWCYVDYEKCRRSNHAQHKSTLFPGLYYSYDTCNATGNFYFEHTTTSNLRGANISVVIPGSLFPYHYKRTAEGEIASYEGPEYYNDTIPYQGSIIDYMDKLQTLTAVNQFSYTFRSGKQGSGFSSSSFSTSVHDVQRGVVDMSASIFAMTSERLLETTFTAPFIVDPNILLVSRPKMDTSLLAQAKTTLAPFSMHLWGLLSLCFITFGSLQVWYANGKGKYQKWWNWFRSDQFRKSSWLHKFGTVATALLEGVWIAFMDFFAGSTSADLNDSLPQKVIQFGTGFLILVAIAAYTANLGER